MIGYQTKTLIMMIWLPMVIEISSLVIDTQVPKGTAIHLVMSLITTHRITYETCTSRRVVHLNSVFSVGACTYLE